jgi:phosphoserine aminotransferase
MLCVEDHLDALRWAESIGGLPALIARSQANLAAVTAWVKATPWVDFLAADPAVRSSTSICLKITDSGFAGQDDNGQAAFMKQLAGLLEKEKAGYDVNGYRDAPAGLRLWGGATVETADLQALFPWLEWAFGQVRQELLAAA